MYSLFDTLTILCTDTIPHDDDAFLHKKNVLTHGDILTITNMFEFDIKRVSADKYNCLMMACQGNCSLSLIKYLIEVHKMNIHSVDYTNTNCLMMACWKNTCLEVVKYLIEGHGMNINQVNHDHDNCLTLACWENTNLEIIKYLIEWHGMSIDHVDCNDDNCLTLACWKNTNLEVVKYLIEDHGLNFEDIEGVSFYRFSAIVLMISKKYRAIDNLLRMGDSYYESNEMNGLVGQINPLQLNDTIRNSAGIENPYNGKFKIFKTYADDLMYCIEPVCR